jgi:hypothetical protein
MSDPTFRKLQAHIADQDGRPCVDVSVMCATAARQVRLDVLEREGPDFDPTTLLITYSLIEPDTTDHEAPLLLNLRAPGSFTRVQLVPDGPIARVQGQVP